MDRHRNRSSRQSPGSGGKYLKKYVFGVRDLVTLFHDLVYILAIVSIVFVFFFRVVTVDGDSMQPTLQDRDRLVLLSNLWYRQPEHGDVVVARIPEFSPDPIVKRVIAVEGDVVDIDLESGTVSVNGRVLQEDYIMDAPQYQLEEQGTAFPLTVEPGCVFLLGDNRNVSYDSRYGPIGQVDVRNILGKAIFLMLPGADEETRAVDLERIGKIR